MSHRSIGQVIAGKAFVAVAGSATVREVARLMQKHRANAVLVVGERKTLAGICTERDIVIGMVAAGRGADETRVRDVMTARPQTLTADKPFCHALHMMYETGFHHVPIIDESGRPLGLLSARDAMSLDVFEFEDELIQREDIAAAL